MVGNVNHKNLEKCTFCDGQAVLWQLVKLRPFLITSGAGFTLLVRAFCKDHGSRVFRSIARDFEPHLTVKQLVEEAKIGWADITYEEALVYQTLNL